MQNDFLTVTIHAIVPAPTGSAIFLGNQEKIFMIYVESSIGEVLSLALSQTKKERPLTHDLLMNIFLGLGVSIECIRITQVENNTFFARMILQMKNELGTKILEMDARPSDVMVLAVLAQKPIYVKRSVFELVQDASDILRGLSEEEG